MSGRRPTDPPARAILGPGQIDALGQAILALSRELWVVTDRMMILEKLLEDKGVPPGAIDAHQPDDALQKALDARRERQLAAVLDALGLDGGR